VPRAFVHTEVDVASLVRRVLDEPIVSLRRFEHGIVNAVYFVRTASGRECVVRVSERRSRDYAALEVWAFRRSEEVGVPVLPLVSFDIDPRDFPEPYLVTQLVPGLLGDSPDLTQGDLLASYEDLGRCAARLHTTTLRGFGELVASGNDFIGPHRSWPERLRAELDGYERTLAAAGRERGLAHLYDARAWLSAHADRFSLARPSLVHGDLQGKNFLVRDGRVAAILDFECAEGGDPILDCRVFHYWDSRGDDLLEAYLLGYGGYPGGGSAADFALKLTFYELIYALLRLCDAYRDDNQHDLDRTFGRIDQIKRRLL
jgi:aminoglycoside phosphotransferase (APT) family kinase protein